MKFQVLASGSQGNMTYIESLSTKIIIDAGIALKEIDRRADIDLNAIDAILITHAHTDHVKSLMPLLRKTKAVMYVNKDTFEEMKSKYHYDFSGFRIQFIENNKQYKIGDFGIYIMELSHDCANCNGFIFVHNSGDTKTSLAYIADTGLVPLRYMPMLNRVDTLILESNHDIQMLMESDRPWLLKQRILSIEGHLSNITCGEVLNKILEENKNLKLVVIAHISRECNNEKVAIDTILDCIKGDYIPKIVFAKQDEASIIFDSENI